MKKAMEQDDLPEEFGKAPDVRHPDTVLLDWMGRRWKSDGDCPITWDGDAFVPVCESGVWPPDMSLRDAIREAMEAEQYQQGGEVMGQASELLCPDCDQPMLPKGERKRPNEYDHASGCPREVKANKGGVK